ncbi:MAG TPA: hypothetical protein ENL35_03985 [Chloroflexi bacterium]|nr:hypothetical protein [Chloroflexota bacterium]
MTLNLLNPILALFLNIFLVLGIYYFGRAIAGPSHITPMKTSTYASGESPPEEMAAPGYRPFFTLALFFAVLHLAALVLGTAIPIPLAVIYLVGISAALLALILG